MATATGAAQASPAPAGPCAWPSFDTAEEGARRVRRALVDVRHKTEDAAADARLTVRRHPLAALSAGVATGALFGAAFGLLVAWLTRPGRQQHLWD
jgi:hypothetical protein